jgi:hypothetical protein
MAQPHQPFLLESNTTSLECGMPPGHTPIPVIFTVQGHAPMPVVGAAVTVRIPSAGSIDSFPGVYVGSYAA